MNRRHLLIGGAAAAAAAAGAGTAWWRRGQEPAEALWSRRFERPGGGELHVEEFHGRPLLVKFWATWCPPCVGELPLLDRHAQTQPGWRVLGLAVDQVQPVRDFLGRHAVSFPIGMAGLDGVELARQLGNSSGGLPFTLVFDSRGKVAARKLGAIASSDLEAWTRTVA